VQQFNLGSFGCGQEYPFVLTLWEMDKLWLEVSQHIFCFHVKMEEKFVLKEMYAGL